MMRKTTIGQCPIVVFSVGQRTNQKDYVIICYLMDTAIWCIESVFKRIFFLIKYQ